MVWLRAVLILCVLAPTLAKADGGLPLVGQDEEGAPIQVIVPKQEYVRRLSRLMEATQASATPVLASVRDRRGWALRTVVVGVGVGLSIGLGPILEVGATPRFKLAFSRDLEPVLP